MLIKQEQRNFAPAPQGVQNGVCVDVVDLGMVSSQYGEKHKLRIVWEIDRLMTEEGPMQGKRFLVMKTYGASLGKKSILRKDLTSWRGRDLTEAEAKEFDLDKVIGVSAQILVVHAKTPDATYANIAAVLPAVEKMVPAGSYKRVKDREGYQAPSMKSSPPEAAPHAADSDGVDAPW